ncbi:MAG: DNA polymerase III subunit delta' [Eggerthellaceae bacterium]|nr:DNA polymerase III subunit delta' [Eggerthellaceae bacterium]MEE0344425.1 DNA polymerase III subunit delta' [Eggerthellaceae bacterium]
MADVFDGIFGQPRVREFFRASIASGRVSHAYLFTGPAGSNKTAAAYAFAQALLCKNKGCRTCDDCKRIERRKHPDVHFYAPEGAQGYLIEQIREIISSVSLAPIRAQGKVYILDRVDLLGVKAANAFLKTLEEPVPGVTFILLGRTREGVLPTIVSRCQVVPFRHIPALEAAGILSQKTGVTPQQARIAIEACNGSITRAIAFAKSAERSEFRARIMEVLANLPLADARDVLEYAAELIERAKAPLDNVRTQQSEELAESADFLTKAALKQVELRHKRTLTMATKESLNQMTSIIRSWLRDVLMIASGTPELVINVDQRQALEIAAQKVTPAGIMSALREAYKTDEALSYNVSPETCLDALLFSIREVLHGSGNSH